MHRKHILDLLDQYQHTYPDEHPTTDRYKYFVQQHKDCFKRSLLSGHVTGSAWLVNRAGSKVLLTHHRKLNMWLQLGGHADGDADVPAVAHREAQEESGIKNLASVGTGIFDLDIHLIPARDTEPEHYHYDARFALQTVDTDEFIVSSESHALEWITITALAQKTTEPSMLRMAEKWCQLQNDN